MARPPCKYWVGTFFFQTLTRLKGSRKASFVQLAGGGQRTDNQNKLSDHESYIFQFLGFSIFISFTCDKKIDLSLP